MELLRYSLLPWQARHFAEEWNNIENKGTDWGAKITQDQGEGNFKTLIWDMFRFTIILAKSPTCVSDQGQPDPGPQGVVVAEKIGQTSLSEYYIMGLCERSGKPAWWSSFSGWNMHQKNTLYIALLYFARQCTRDLQTSAPRIFAQLALFSSSETWILKIWPSELRTQPDCNCLPGLLPFS